MMKLPTSSPITAEGLQDAILMLQAIPPRSDGKLWFKRCPKCGDPYNIEAHPETCDGTTIREMMARKRA